MPWPDEIITHQPISKSKKLGAKSLRRVSTPSERILWSALRNRKLGFHFRRQQVIAGYIVDFYCHSAALVIELDGSVHASQLEQDAKRDDILAKVGLRIVRFTNKQVEKDLAAVLETISTLLSTTGGI